MIFRETKPLNMKTILWKSDQIFCFRIKTASPVANAPYLPYPPSKKKRNFLQQLIREFSGAWKIIWGNQIIWADHQKKKLRNLPMVLNWCKSWWRGRRKERLKGWTTDDNIQFQNCDNSCSLADTRKYHRSTYTFTIITLAEERLKTFWRPDYGH